MRASSFIRVHAADNVAVAREAVPAGATVHVDGLAIETIEAIPAGHKVALETIAAGHLVQKYGFPIGTALQSIRAGSWVHTHNCLTRLSSQTELVYQPARVSGGPAETGTTFEGYLRSDGRTGTRNEIWVLNTVGCVNHAAEALRAWRVSGWQA